MYIVLWNKAYSHHFLFRVKQEDNELKKKLKTTGGGRPPKPPQPSEEMAIATSMMGDELAMGDGVYDTLQTHPVDEAGEPLVDVTLSKSLGILNEI